MRDLSKCLNYSIKSPLGTLFLDVKKNIFIYGDYTAIKYLYNKIALFYREFKLLDEPIELNFFDNITEKQVDILYKLINDRLEKFKEYKYKNIWHFNNAMVKKIKIEYIVINNYDKLDENLRKKIALCLKNSVDVGLFFIIEAENNDYELEIKKDISYVVYMDLKGYEIRLLKNKELSKVCGKINEVK